MIFSNIFYDSKYGNLFIKKEINFMKFFPRRKPRKTFKETSNTVYKALLKAKKIYPIYYNHFPGFGADFHYFGTIPINSRKNYL